MQQVTCCCGSGPNKRKPFFLFKSFGNAVGAMYVREYFDEAARQSAIEMVKDIREVFTEMIDELEWLDEETKLRAKEKATAMFSHIAYPDELLDDKKLTDRYEDASLGLLITQ